ncbi:MAG: hypothetical protein A2Z20_12555 [Bdellovibrionales bacterium RBG_16_40_8]|nr:MAG: hypothetical protein A2Z20_12555 [Bdellovibrionales bacterium RBG_16_40_8]
MKQFFSILLFLSGCTLAPTKTYMTEDINTQKLVTVLKKPINITNETIILDARAPFEFAVAHLPQAVNIRSSDFGKDPSAEVRRLALLGISPQSQVVILGLGLNGAGEEGHMAWTLLYLGVENVQTAQADSLGLRYSNLIPPPRANAPTWEPRLRGSIRASKQELLRVAMSKFDDRAHILDVRSKKEFFSKNRDLEYEVPDLRAVNIEWKDFFTQMGRPNLAMRDQLRAVQINPNDRVIVISNNGLRSAATTYALLSLGYKNAASFAGGYTELLKK